MSGDITHTGCAERTTQRASGLLGRKRIAAGFAAAVALATAALGMGVGTPASASLTGLERAERFLAFDGVNEAESAAFRDIELSTAQSAVVDAALDTAAEQHCLAEAIYYEARSESHLGKVAVAEVVKNRVESRHYPASICGVVYQGAERALSQGKKNCQFSFACDGSMDRWTPVGERWEEAQNMAAISLEGGYREITKAATHYHATYVKPPWARRLKRTAKVGKHIFYQDLPFRSLAKQREQRKVAELAVAP